MILRLDIERLRTLEEVRDFLAGSEPVDFHFTDRRGAYDFVTRALRRLNYSGLSKAHKGVVRRFVAKVTGWSRAQTTRLIGQYRKTGRIEDRRRGATHPFERRYTAADIRLLAEVDEKLGGVCGPSTRRVMQRQYELFGDRRFERLAGCRTAICTVCATVRRTGVGAIPRRRPSPPRSALASAANRTRRGVRVFCGWTRCTKATSMATRGCTKSTSWMK